ERVRKRFEKRDAGGLCDPASQKNHSLGSSGSGPLELCVELHPTHLGHEEGAQDQVIGKAGLDLVQNLARSADDRHFMLTTENALEDLAVLRWRRLETRHARQNGFGLS